jgi:hypothetical protein
MRLSILDSAFYAIALTTSSGFAASYSQTESIVGSNFLDAFSFQNIPDPTNGRV